MIVSPSYQIVPYASVFLTTAAAQLVKPGPDGVASWRSLTLRARDGLGVVSRVVLGFNLSGLDIPPPISGVNISGGGGALAFEGPQFHILFPGSQAVLGGVGATFAPVLDVAEVDGLTPGLYDSLLFPATVGSVTWFVSGTVWMRRGAAGRA